MRMAPYGLVEVGIPFPGGSRDLLNRMERLFRVQPWEQAVAPEGKRWRYLVSHACVDRAEMLIRCCLQVGWNTPSAWKGGPVEHWLLPARLEWR